MKLGMRESLVIPFVWRRTFISLKIVYCSLLSEGIYSPFWGVTSFSHERDIQKKQHRRLEINAINSITTIHFIDLWSDRETVITFHCIVKSFGRGVYFILRDPFSYENKLRKWSYWPVESVSSIRNDVLKTNQKARRYVSLNTINHYFGVDMCILMMTR